jgi:hypothetical protein
MYLGKEQATYLEYFPKGDKRERKGKIESK